MDFLNKQLRHPREKLNSQKQQITQFQAALNQQIQHTLAQQHARLQHSTAVLHALSPYNILQRGYSMVQTPRGELITSAAQLKAGQKVRLIFADGERDVRVEKTQHNLDLFD